MLGSGKVWVIGECEGVNGKIALAFKLLYSSFVSQFRQELILD